MKVCPALFFALLALAGCSQSTSDPAPVVPANKPSLVGTWQATTSHVVTGPPQGPYDHNYQFAPGDETLSFTSAGTAMTTSKGQSPNNYTYTFDGTTLVFTYGSDSVTHQVLELSDHRLLKTYSTVYSGSTTTFTQTYTR